MRATTIALGALGVAAMVGVTIMAVRGEGKAKEQRAAHLAALPQPIQDAIRAANGAFRDSRGAHDASAMAASAAVRDAAHGGNLIGQFNDSYNAIRAASNASGIIATAAVDRGWDVARVRGDVQRAYHDLHASADAAGVLAVTAVDTGTPIKDIERTYRDATGTAFNSALIADAAIRHERSVSSLNTDYDRLQDHHIWGDAAAVLVAASASSGRAIDDLATDYDKVTDAKVWSGRVAALLTGGAAEAGVPVETAIDRWNQMDRHLSVSGEASAIIVASRLLGEQRPDADAPTWMYAIETEDDD